MPAISLYFKGETPPIVDSHAFDNTTSKTITIYVPAVKDGTTVNVTATNARIEQFKTALGKGDDYFNIQYYTAWPFN